MREPASPGARPAPPSLTRAPPAVVTARNGKEAMDVLECQTRPDLILTDIMMPEVGIVRASLALATPAAPAR